MKELHTVWLLCGVLAISSAHQFIKGEQPRLNEEMPTVALLSTLQTQIHTLIEASHDQDIKMKKILEMTSLTNTKAQELRIGSHHRACAEQLTQVETQLSDKNTEFLNTKMEIKSTSTQLQDTTNKLVDAETNFADMKTKLSESKAQLAKIQEELKILREESDNLIFKEMPRDQRVLDGSVASFTCRATGDTEPTIKWLLEGKSVTTDYNHIILNITHGSVLRIEPVKLEDADEFECVAENPAGDTIRAKALLEVLSAEVNARPTGFPFFVAPRRRHKEVDEGLPVSIDCDSGGIPEPKITWYKDHRPVDLSNTRYSVLQSGTLHINPADTGDEGRYDCEAQNQVGSAFSVSIYLFVRDVRMSPRFVEPLLEDVYEVGVGGSLNITCAAFAKPPASVLWMRDNAAVTVSVRNSNVLVLKDIREAAVYTCIADSTLGKITSTVEVKVKIQGFHDVDHSRISIGAEHFVIVWEVKGWSEGRSYCQSQHSDLAEPEHVLKLVEEFHDAFTKSGRSGEIWAHIGARQNDTNSSWQWVSGALLSEDNPAWAEGDPQGTLHHGGPVCANMWTGWEGMWDGACSAKTFFICEV